MCIVVQFVKGKRVFSRTADLMMLLCVLMVNKLAATQCFIVTLCCDTFYRHSKMTCHDLVSSNLDDSQRL